MFEALNASLLATETISRAMNSAANATEMAGDEAVQSGVEFGSLGSALDQVDDEAIQMAVGMRTAKGAVDEMGDEALQAALETKALDSAMDDAATSSLGLAASMGPLRGSIGTMGPLVTGVVPPLFGLAGALGGVATAAGTAAGGIAAIAFGGLQRKAENMAAASSQFEDSSEAMQAIFEDFGSQLKEATEPLQTAANTEFAMSGLEGLIELVGIASRGFAQMSGTLREVGSMFGGEILASAPAVFDELDATLTALMPSLEALASVLGDVPLLIAFLRESTVRVQSEMIGLGGAVVDAAAGLTTLGVAILDVVLPVLNPLLSLIGWTATLIGSLPEPVLAAAGAFAVYTAVVAVYGGVAGAAAAATGVLATAVGVITAPISATAVAIGALIAAVVGVISYFGLWDDIIGVIMGAWNALVSYIEFSIETMVLVGTVIGQLIGTMWDLVLTVTGLGTILDWLGSMWDWIVGVINDAIDMIMGWIDSAIAAIQSLMDWAMSVVNAIPGVSVDFGDIQETINLDALKGGDPGEQEDSPDKVDQSEKKKEATNHYDFSGADFGGASQSQVEQTVAEAVRKANSESRAREDGQQF
jgi:phage-related protein